MQFVGVLVRNVIYSGSQKDSMRDFHEIIPGLEALAIKPSGEVMDGSEELIRFWGEVTLHFMNRASERESISFKTYETCNADQQSVTEIIPENYGTNRGLLPAETFSGSDIEKKEYPNPFHEFYLVYDIQGKADEEFSEYLWDVTKLSAYKHHRGSGLPFAVSLGGAVGRAFK